jgi:hypothetical protein
VFERSDGSDPDYNLFADNIVYDNGSACVRLIGAHSKEHDNLGYSTTATAHAQAHAHTAADGSGAIASDQAASITNSAIPLRTERSGAYTNATLTALAIRHMTSADMVNGFGPVLGFEAMDSAGVSNTLAAIGAARAGADGTGDLVFQPATGGARAEKGRLTSSGDFTVAGGFGTNGAAAQPPYASGGALAAYVTGAYGLDSDAHMQALYDLVVAIRAALVAAGIMS